MSEAANLATASTAPLRGLRVVELARILAGPWIGQTLADLGADVIKVEAPEGDETRRWGPPFVEGRDGQPLDAAYFHACNRGKRSVVADFRSKSDLAMVHRLVERAEHVLHCVQRDRAGSVGDGLIGQRQRVAHRPVHPK